MAIERVMVDEQANESTTGLDEPTLAAETGSHGELHQMPVTGSRIGDYEILNEIARGAMGIVFRAKHQQLNRIVALKMVLDGEDASDELRLRFTNEAKAAASLDHPGIVPVFDVGQWNSYPFFTMAYIEGQSLAAALQTGPLPQKRSAEIAKEVSDAIDHAHQHLIIHRDVKPANILIDRCGAVRVTDFGVSKILNSANELTQCGELIGTPHFMPPEQAGDSSQSVGPASDVYSIGAVMYAMLTGRPPFQAASPLDVVAQVISQQPVLPSALNASVPVELDVITMKCLAKRTSERYQTARELSDDLSRYLQGVPILAKPPGFLQKARLLFRKHVVFASVSGTASLVLVLLTVALFVNWIQAQRHITELSGQLETTKQLLLSERGLTEKYISSQRSQDTSAAVVSYKIDRLAATSVANAESNPDLALQLAIASIRLALENDQAPATQTLNWLRDQLNAAMKETFSPSPDSLSAEATIEAATELIVQPLDASQRQLYGIDEPTSAEDANIDD